MKAEFSRGALPSPVMSRAPSNTVTPAVGVWAETLAQRAAASSDRHPARTSKDDGNFTAGQCLANLHVPEFHRPAAVLERDAPGRVLRILNVDRLDLVDGNGQP